MNFSGKPVVVTPSTLERFLEDHYIWLFLSFVLSADIASSLYSATPLVRLENLPIGRILIFFTLFSILLVISRLVNYSIFLITAPVINIFNFFKKRKSPEDEERDDERLKREREARMKHSVYVFKLRKYAIEHDNQILYDLAQHHEEKKQMHEWMLHFKFIVGLLLSITPFLKTSTLHLVFEHLDKNIWLILPLAILLMLYGTHSDQNSNDLVYVGELTAKKINGS